MEGGIGCQQVALRHLVKTENLAADEDSERVQQIDTVRLSSYEKQKRKLDIFTK